MVAKLRQTPAGPYELADVDMAALQPIAALPANPNAGAIAAKLAEVIAAYNALLAKLKE